MRGDVVELIPAYSRDTALRLEFFSDELEAILETDPLTGEVLGSLRRTIVFPASHYVSDRDNLHRAAADIREELRLRLAEFQAANRLVEAQRLEQRTLQDLEMIEELGYCTGIENYSGTWTAGPPASRRIRFWTIFPRTSSPSSTNPISPCPRSGACTAATAPASRPWWITGSGCPRPGQPASQFRGVSDPVGRMVFVSATPGPWEIERSQGVVVEQIIRPTGLVDPQVEVRRTRGQVDDLLAECRARMAADERVLVTTLTKRMAEDLTDYLNAMGATARYLHSDIDTLERVAIIQALRQGNFPCWWA